MRPKQFLSLWYVRCKPYTYLASTLALSPNGPNELPLEPHHLVLPSSASKTISEPMVRLAQTMHLSCTDTNTVSKRKEVRLHMTHVTFGVPSGATKMIYEPMVCSTQTVQLSCVKISTISKRSELSLEPRHLGYDRVCPTRFLSLWYV